MLIQTARLLDKHSFLNFHLWEISLRNSPRPFPWIFIFFVLLRRPVHAWRGFRRYQELVRQSAAESITGTMSLHELLDRTAQPGYSFKDLVLAPGFCLKPWDYSQNICACPAGHFNHRCILLDKPEWLKKDKLPLPCNQCKIAALAKLANSLGASFYIMTSAIDIAHDLYKPALLDRGPKIGLFFLCAYSAEAFTYGLCTSGMEGASVTFCSGDCSNFDEFTRADVGIKKTQTTLDKGVLQRILNMGNSRRAINNNSRFVQKGNVYHLKD